MPQISTGKKRECSLSKGDNQTGKPITANFVPYAAMRLIIGLKFSNMVNGDEFINHLILNMGFISRGR